MWESILSRNFKSNWILAFIPFAIILSISFLLNGWDDLQIYFIRFPLKTIISLALLIPFFLFAYFHTEHKLRKSEFIFIAVIFFVLNEACLYIPYIFHSSGWNWEGELLSILSAILLIYFCKKLTLHDIGLTNKFIEGSIFPVILVISIVLISGILMAKRGNGGSPISTWLFQATLPGLNEELLYRGVLLTLANKVFGKSWKLAGAKIGWGFILTTLLFSFVHMVSVSNKLDLSINLNNFFNPFTGGLVFAYVKERSGNLWAPVIFHNLTNTAGVLVGYLPV